MFGVSAIYNIFFCGESLRVQTGGLGGIAQNEFMEFQLRLNILPLQLGATCFLTGGQDILHILAQKLFYCCQVLQPREC